MQVWRSIFLLFWPGNVRSSWLLPYLAGTLLLKMLPPPHAVAVHIKQSPSDWLQLAGQLLWADFLPHCLGLIVHLYIFLHLSKLSLLFSHSLLFWLHARTFFTTLFARSARAEQTLL